MLRWILPCVLLVGLGACQSAEPELVDPISMDELVQLSRGGADDPAFVAALGGRPLGFPVTYETVRELERRGVTRPCIDATLASTPGTWSGYGEDYPWAFWSDPYYHFWPQGYYAARYDWDYRPGAGGVWATSWRR